MKDWDVPQLALAYAVTAALLYGCGGSPPTAAAPAASPQNRSLRLARGGDGYKVLHTFEGMPNDGAFPAAGLVAVRGTLYGTTGLGGADHGGTVYSITRRGTVTLLHSFTKTPDGRHPVGSLLNDHGTLYGTTSGGGGQQRGIIYSVTTSGAEQILHRFFEHGAKGAHPAAGLIDVGGILYGTTRVGGTPHGHRGVGRGTVFRVTPAGVENAIHKFTGSPDGADPKANLIDVGGTLYGTTSAGGTYGSGTVFSITTSGVESVLYSFGGKNDGDAPVAALLDVGGVLYGTTKSGGAYDKGTVFSVTTGGVERVLYSFGNGIDGASPAASLIDVNGTLYGTTSGGGTYGGGTVFSITTNGKETVVHDFSGGAGGNYPQARLLDVGGILYGTTTFGGDSKPCANGGCGTVFKLLPR